MELRNLITFIHVAELGSFTKAAEQLGYSQSTISFQIKQLEDELGEGLTVVYYLRDKTLCADPGTRSKSAYAVEAHVTLPTGEEKIAFLDPKTKVLRCKFNYSSQLW